MATKTRTSRVSYNGKSAKYWVFQMWLDDPETFDPKAAQEKYPSVDFETIVTWESRWRNWNRITFTGTDGFPRGSADSPEKIARIKVAIKKAREARAMRRDGAPPRRKVPPNQNYAGELPVDREYVEGAISKVLVNRYERDPKARAACLEEFGRSCKVCGLNFRKRYGEIGDGFIHVHHRKPLALRKTEYRLNPAEDLVPICPNCHAMLHTSDPPLEIEELREIWQKHGKA